jgi:hypothetical protein
VSAEVLGDKASPIVLGSSCRVPDHESDGFVFVEIRRGGVGHAREKDGTPDEEKDERQLSHRDLLISENV